MRPIKLFAFWSMFCLTFACALPAVAGPIFSCVKAVSSNNGNFIVLIDAQLEPGQGDPANAQRFFLQVFSKETVINARDKLMAPATH
jgi:hypothetical protein